MEIKNARSGGLIKKKLHIYNKKCYCFLTSVAVFITALCFKGGGEEDNEKKKKKNQFKALTLLC